MSSIHEPDDSGGSLLSLGKRMHTVFFGRAAGSLLDDAMLGLSKFDEPWTKNSPDVVVTDTDTLRGFLLRGAAALNSDNTPGLDFIPDDDLEDLRDLAGGAEYGVPKCEGYKKRAYH